MDTSEKLLTPRSLYGMLDNLQTEMPLKLSLRQSYLEKPITMHRTYPGSEPMKWPLVIRNAYAQIWLGKHQRVIIKAPRGGGKSKLLGTVGFDLWYLKQRKVVNMGGSFVQAQIVYNYFKGYCDMDASVTLKADGSSIKLKMAETKAEEGHTFHCVTASSKQVRGKHPDALISDETCETADEIVHAALPMVNDSEHPLVIMASTFHKIYGIFQETWDAADERGYLRIQWDIFDVCKIFPADFWERDDIKDVQGVEKLKAYAKGRTGDPDGWIPIENVIQAWKEKPTEDWFEVEYLGSRPSAAGLVLKPEDIDRAMFDSELDNRYNYIQGATCILGIDWGFSSMTAVTEFMGHQDQVVVMLDNKNYHQTPSDKIIADVVEKVKQHKIRFIYADSAGKFENIALQNALVKEKLSCKVIEVVFSKEKFGTPGEEGSIGMLGNLRAHFEQSKIKIPRKIFRDGEWRTNLEAYWQYKRYRYQEGTDKPVKKDDHIPDSTMCALQHFIIGKVSRAIPIDLQPTKPENNRTITHGLLKKQF